MSLYGTPQIRVEDDQTDRIGIRTLILSMLWQPSRWPLSLPELDAEKPGIPEVAGGVLLIGEQTRPLRGALRTFWTFEGIAGSGKDVTFKGRGNSLDYSFEPGFSQVSIIKHKNWVALKKAWNGNVIDGQVIWPEFISGSTSADGRVKDASDGKTNPMFGHDDFFRMEGTYSFRYASFTVPSNKGVGKIAASLPGTPPSVPNRNWLLASIPWQRRGPVIDITEVYWLSGEGGWPLQIYSDNPEGLSGPTNSLSPANESFVPADFNQ